MLPLEAYSVNSTTRKGKPKNTAFFPRESDISAIFFVWNLLWIGRMEIGYG